MKKLAVLVVHGMGDQQTGFSAAMTREVNDRVESAGLQPADVEWHELLWAPVLSDVQDDLWDKMKSSDLDFLKLRRFVVHALGDAVGYRPVDEDKTGALALDTYGAIQAKVGAEMRVLKGRLDAENGGASDVPLVVVAHSLGAHIMSNYVWDRQHSDESLGSDFEDMRTLSGIFTFGCNIPLFTLAYKKIEPIRFPLPVAKYFPRGTGAAKIKAATKWWNLYDPDDVLGWPLRPLNKAYEKAVAGDIVINAGGPFTSWNPLSHSAYWEDNDFTRRLAAAIGELLKLL